MDKPVVEVETVIAADPGTVWKAMTRKKSAMFPGTEVVTDWQVGHPMTIRGDWQGKPFEDHGEIRSFDEGRELSFTHWSGKEGKSRPESYHSVRYRLAPKGDKTHVTLSQFNEGKDRRIDAKTKAEFEKNWTMMLDGLKKSAESTH
jgi:uncharacterized protein YndB with AHSA1/START domain